MRRVAIVIALPALVAACALLTNLDDLGGSSDAVGVESSIDVSNPGDAGADPSVVIAQVGGVASETGNVQQTHLVYAQATGQYVLFYITDTDTTHLRTRMSTDFALWTEGPALALPYTHGKDGREVSVSYAKLANVDVVHIAMSHEISLSSRKHTHTRAVISAGAIAFGTPEDVTQTTANPSTAVNPDAPATLVTSSGVVMDATGWAPIVDAGGSSFNSNVLVAKGTDTGAAFTSNGWTQVDLEQTVRHVNSRELFEANGRVHLFWDNADVKPNPTNVRTSTLDQGTWSAPATVFSTSANPGEMEDDWCATFFTPLAFDVIRQTASLGFEHVAGTTTFAASFGLPPIQRAPGSGLACVVPGGDLVATIALDGTIATTRATANAFAPWTTIVPTPRQRAYVALSPAANGKTAVIWTQVGTSGYEVAGILQ